MSTSALKRLSWDEYVERERDSEIKHQFWDGEIFAMSGATRRHNVVAGNFFAEVHNLLKGGDCEIYQNDMRVRCPNGLGTYPDVAVACPPEFDTKKQDTLHNPVIIVEVLSPSTEAYDRGKKFHSYQTLPSLREYILIAQESCAVDHYIREDATANWTLRSMTSLEDQLQLPTLDVTIPLLEVYAQVEFDPEDATLPSDPAAKR